MLYIVVESKQQQSDWDGIFPEIKRWYVKSTHDELFVLNNHLPFIETKG